jgi:NADPH:quinone reductase-like Zn-dependent oxidoreductase
MRTINRIESVLALTMTSAAPHVALSGTNDLARLCKLMADGRLDGQVEFEGSWREPAAALEALLERRIGGKAVLHVD